MKQDNEILSFIYKLVISYKGTNYKGWQFQTTQTQTVQAYVEDAIRAIAKGNNFSIQAASRTDTGVHASGQVLKIKLPKSIATDKFIIGMNRNLPNDIRVVSCECASKELNVNRDPIHKEYHYYFTLNQSQNSISSDILFSHPDDIDLLKMQNACVAFTGTHNFLSFCNRGSQLGSNIREILSCSIEKTKMLTLDQEIYYLKIKGTGFLKYMVRYLMGAIWDVGLGKLSIDEINLSLKDGQEYGIRNKALPHGLHLINIKYKSRSK